MWLHSLNLSLILTEYEEKFKDTFAEVMSHIVLKMIERKMLQILVTISIFSICAGNEVNSSMLLSSKRPQLLRKCVQHEAPS